MVEEAVGAAGGRLLLLALALAFGASGGAVGGQRWWGGRGMMARLGLRLRTFLLLLLLLLVGFEGSWGIEGLEFEVGVLELEF